LAKVFICHRRADHASAKRLAKDLRRAGHVVWLDAWEIKPGASIPEEINKGLANTGYVIVCFSEHGEGRWSSSEMWSTFARQLNGQPIRVIPTLLRGGSLPAFIADRHPADLAADWSSGIKQILNALE
jgi:hypothetical protein